MSLDVDVDEAQRDSVSDGGPDGPRTAQVVRVVVRISGRRQHGLHASSYQVTTASGSCHAHAHNVPSSKCITIHVQYNIIQYTQTFSLILLCCSVWLLRVILCAT